MYYALLSRPGPLLGLLDYYLLGRLGSRSWNSDDFVLVGKLGGGSYGNAFSGVQLQVSVVFCILRKQGWGLVRKLRGGSYSNAFSGVSLQVSAHSAAGCTSRVGVLLLSLWHNP